MVCITSNNESHPVPNTFTSLVYINVCNDSVTVNFWRRIGVHGAKRWYGGTETSSELATVKDREDILLCRLKHTVIKVKQNVLNLPSKHNNSMNISILLWQHLSVLLDHLQASIQRYMGFHSTWHALIVLLFDILLTVHLIIFILILTNLMHYIL